MQDFDDIPKVALDWHRAGKGAALATVVETWGSAPRGVGSQLAISGDGQMAGSVSGGCVEGAVVVEALDALEEGRPRVLEYGVSDDEAFAVGLACGGTIRVLVEPVSAMGEDTLAALVAARDDRRPVAYTVDLRTWNRGLSGPEDFPERFGSDKSGFEGDLFIGLHNPPLKLIVVGAVHIAQNLTRMAALAGFAPHVIDPREAFASGDRFPDTALYHDWPDAAVRAIGLDARTGVVLLTHDPKLDDPALIEALGSAAFYVGALGSKRTHAKRVERLRSAGLTEAQIARIDAPVGLDIGAKTPAEIAVAILAAMIRALRSA